MSERQGERMTARFEAASAEERGRMIMVLVGHAIAYTVVNGGLATALAGSAVRIWRRRDRGLVQAVRDGGYWRTVAGLAVASAGLSVVRRSVIVPRFAGDPAAPGPDDAEDE